MSRYKKRHASSTSEFYYDDDCWIVFIEDPDEPGGTDELACVQTKTLADLLIAGLEGEERKGGTLADAVRAADAVAAAEVVVLLPVDTYVVIMSADGRQILGEGKIASERIESYPEGQTGPRAPGYLVALKDPFWDPDETFFVVGLFVHEDRLVVPTEFKRPKLDATGEDFVP